MAAFGLSIVNLDVPELAKCLVVKYLAKSKKS
jgi:hypothetical protein